MCVCVCTHACALGHANDFFQNSLQGCEMDTLLLERLISIQAEGKTPQTSETASKQGLLL